MLISKHFDPVLGIDIHILIIPPAGPVPIPHPHIALVFDVIDYVPILGATVKVGGLPRSTAGTAGKPIPHIPMGGPFAKPPMNENEILMGSATVLADGGPLSFTALPTLSCHDIGIIAPPRKKKPKKSFGMVLPTSVVISIPLGMPVMVGGPPTVDMMGLAMMGGFAVLGGAFKKLRKMQKKSKRMKNMSDAIHNRAKKAMDKLGVPPNARNKIHKGICTVTGHPVDVATGKMFTDHIDFSLPGPLPLVWERTWYSTSVYDGPLGHGWHHSYDVKLCEIDNAVGVRLADGRSIAFPALDINETCFDRQERMTLLRDEEGYALDTSDGKRYRFAPFQEQLDNQLLVSLSQKNSGAKIEFFYNEKGQLNQIIDSGGRLIRLTYTDDNRIHKIYLPEPESNVTRDHTNPTFFCAIEHHYREGMLVQVDDALQQPLHYVYDHKLLIKETFRNGLSFYFQYDGLDHNARCLRTWGDEGIYYRDIRYDLESNITYVKDSLGYVTVYYHNGVLPHRIVDARNNTIVLEHSEYAQLRRESNQLGQTTGYEYDDVGNLIKVINADGSNVELTFDENQKLIAMIDPVGNSWCYEYDASGRLTIKTDPMDHKTCYEYVDNLLTKITDASDNQFFLRYDQNLNLSGISDGKTEQASFQYDALGNLLSTKDNLGNRRNLSYDKLSRVNKIEENDGNIRRYAYDGANSVIRAKDHDYDIFFSYSGMGRLVSRTQGNVTLKFEYDTEEKLKAIINEHGHVYQFERDANGEIITETGFDGVTRQHIRDPAGRTIRLNRPGQRYSSYRYDQAGRVRQISHSDGSHKTFEYRADGQLLKASADTATLAWELDALGRVVKEHQDEFWVAYEYDNLGYRTHVKSSMGLDQKIKRNRGGDVLQVSTGEDHFKAIFDRDNQGNEIQRSLPGGIESRWVRDKLGRPLRHQITHGKEISASKTYVWGLNKRLIKLIDSLSRETLFQHDAIGNLLSARYADNTYDLRAPDAVGNLFKTLPQKDREYGAAGQLLAVHGSKGVTRYKYDEEGNLIRKTEPGDKVWHYEWNGSGFLAKVTKPDGEEIHFKYDALGRRTHKIHGNKITRWVWDHNNPLHEWVEYSKAESDSKLSSQFFKDGENIFAETRSIALQPITPNAPPKSFAEGSKDEPITWLFEPDSARPMARLVGQDYHSVVTDHIGTPSFIFDKTGKQVWSADISIWGELRNLKGERELCPFRFPGQYEDSETGLYYNRFRYYDAHNGHYISQDPIKLAGGISAYTYVKDTTIGIDSLGLNDETPSDPLTDGLRESTQQEMVGKSKGQLRRDAALSRASVDDLDMVSPDYKNLPGSVKNFPGVEQIDDMTFKVTDKTAFMNEVDRLYGAGGGNPLNPTTKGLILDHLGDASKTFPTHAGIPGLHAEVQAFNNIMNRAPDVELSKIKVATFKLAPGNGQGKPFGACSNCGSILPKSVNVLTGIKAV